MRYEVEQKHCVEDVAALEARLAERGAAWDEPIEQADQYFAHPCRDFAQTDEALRVRTVGKQSFVTYKGPKIDATTKTRREIEFPLHADDEGGREMVEVLQALGFKPVATVRKSRTPFVVTVEGHEVDGALDRADGVGTFVELELQADKAGLEEAKRLIAALAENLELGPTERRSYLEMLLEKRP